MKKFLNLSLILAILFTITFTSCKKYPDGPTISLASKTSRVANIWVIDQIFENGTDVTAYYLAFIGNSYSIEYTKDGNVTATAGIITQTGTWAFDGSKENLITSISGSSKTEKILRLKSDEMWLSETDNGGNVTETHLRTK